VAALVSRNLTVLYEYVYCWQITDLASMTDQRHGERALFKVQGPGGGGMVI
jgi:hypothetical protein